MKIVTTITENNSVKIQRFENDVCVGERSIRLVDYCKGFIKPLPMGAIFEHLCTEKSELEEYLNELEEPENFDQFLISIFENLSTSWYEENPAFLNYLAVAFNRLSSVKVDNPYLIDFLTSIAKKADKIPLEDNMATLVIVILKRFLKEENNSKVLDKKKIEIFNAIISTLKTEHKNELKNAISHLTPHMDSEWFYEMMTAMEKVQATTNKKITFFSGKLPPGLSYFNVNSRGTSFVYEVAKTRLRVKFFDTPIEDVGHPRLLAIYKLSGEKVSSMKLVAVKEHDEINDDMDVYHYPYAHVFNNGSVCWYGYQDFTKDLLPNIANLFLSTSNSNHMVNNCLELYKEYEGKDFDDSKLKLLGKLEELL
ncbi:hypothetical protein ACOMCU_22555 [Lysinibacillus sp. UGB7]|uniref:hypothetical protein n=1 Tax=Lysinibacillus sp. UGB7 TaxID=3411039 RepID=UPI003B816250